MDTLEIRNLSLEELKIKVAEEKERYHKLVLSHSVSPIENPLEIRKQRRLIARMKTILNQKTEI